MSTSAVAPKWAAGVALGTVAADQLSKTWAVSALDDRVIDLVGSLRLRLVDNTGFAFSIGEGLGPLLGIAAIVISVILWRTRTKLPSGVGQAAVGLVIGGAIGNLLDRLLRGEAWLRGGVVDFIDLQFWPVFNLADSAIVVGVIALFFLFSRAEPRSVDSDA